MKEIYYIAVLLPTRRTTLDCIEKSFMDEHYFISEEQLHDEMYELGWLEHEYKVLKLTVEEE